MEAEERKEKKETTAYWELTQPKLYWFRVNGGHGPPYFCPGNACWSRSVVLLITAAESECVVRRLCFIQNVILC